MLGIRKVKHLAASLDATPAELDRITSFPDEFYEILELRHPQKNKVRKVVNVKGEMRALQIRLYRRILLSKLKPSVFSHGGVTGRSIKTNVYPHRKSRFAARIDISDFYPSVHSSRIYRLFVNKFECSPDVARFCTKICTYNHRLELGLITSPILADQILRPVDVRIAGLCAKANLVYTRYVDDITISGGYDLKKRRFADLVGSILSDNGFKAKRKKTSYGRLSDGFTITNLRQIDGRMDVRKEYVDELIRQLSDANALAKNEVPSGPYYTGTQILGRVRFVCWVNPGRKRELIQRFRAINWKLVKRHAEQRGIKPTRATLTRVCDQYLNVAMAEPNQQRLGVAGKTGRNNFEKSF